MGTIKLIFGIFVIVAGIYLGAELIPVYYENYQFQDVVKTEATLETYTSKPEDDIRDMLYKKAQSMDIPLSRDQIKCSVTELRVLAPYY